jgi:hypothetical protein
MLTTEMICIVKLSYNEKIKINELKKRSNVTYLEMTGSDLI